MLKKKNQQILLKKINKTMKKTLFVLGLFGLTMVACNKPESMTDKPVKDTVKIDTVVVELDSIKAVDTVKVKTDSVKTIKTKK